jgi:hypothetical protein
VFYSKLLRDNCWSFVNIDQTKATSSGIYTPKLVATEAFKELMKSGSVVMAYFDEDDDFQDIDQILSDPPIESMDLTPTNKGLPP